MDNRSGVVPGFETGETGLNQAISPAEHQRVMAGCDDVPEQQPSFPLPLDAVGIAGKTVWVRLPQGRLPFEAELEVGLAGSRRGIHMSRLEEVIAALHDRSFQDLREYGRLLGEEMVAGQGARQGRVRLAGKLPVLRDTVASGRTSLDSVDLFFELTLVRGESGLEQQAMVGVGAYHITACPCTQAYNEVLFRLAAPAAPLPTHSQRSYTRLAVGAREAEPSYQELLACLEAALHVTQDLLKRPDEAEVVLKAHRFPQFAEDTARETALAVGRRFTGRLPGATRVRIESKSLESIHIHDVYCRLETRLDRISALSASGS